MKRDIVCEECELKYHGYPASIDGLEVVVKKIHGIALKDYCCASCNKEIPRNSKCVAISVIVEGQQYYKWESEFVEDSK